jgi:pentatricopeptide repeat protein
MDANVAELRMLGDFSTRCHLEIWSPGHVKHRKVQKALELFGQMQHQCMHQSSSLLLLTNCNLEGEFWRIWFFL